MTLMERIYLPAILGGLFITIKHFFRLKRPTIQYPEAASARSARSTVASTC
jgi:NADH-quinone oxidoreductase subunit I